MTYNATALGTDTAPTREGIEEAVLEFDDANNGYSARVEFHGGDEYLIVVDAGGPLCVTFDRLYEFKAWAFEQEKKLDELETIFNMELEGATK